MPFSFYSVPEAGEDGPFLNGVPTILQCSATAGPAALAKSLLGSSFRKNLDQGKEPRTKSEGGVWGGWGGGGGMGEEEDVAVGVHPLGCSGKCHVIVVTNGLYYITDIIRFFIYNTICHCPENEPPCG